MAPAMREEASKEFYIWRNQRKNKLEIKWITTIGTCCWKIWNNSQSQYEEISIGHGDGFGKEPDVNYVFKIVGNNCDD